METNSETLETSEEGFRVIIKQETEDLEYEADPEIDPGESDKEDDGFNQEDDEEDDNSLNGDCQVVLEQEIFGFVKELNLAPEMAETSTFPRNKPKDIPRAIRTKAQLKQAKEKSDRPKISSICATCKQPMQTSGNAPQCCQNCKDTQNPDSQVPKNNQCKFCDKFLECQDSLVSHESTHSGEIVPEENYFDRTFQKPSQLREHKIAAVAHQCKYCIKVYNHPSSLRRHIKMHSIKSVYWCKYCGERFHILGQFTEHERKYVPQESHQCNSCNKVYKRSRDLKKHEKLHDNDDKALSHQCKYCGKVCAQKGNLIEHERKHTNEKPYQCRYCGKPYKYSSNLLWHEKKHAGKRPSLLCKFCGKECHQINHLREHERLHTGEKPYQCKHCHKFFSHCSNFRKHERIHDGVKRYLCVYCGKAYSTSSILKTHEMKHRGERPHQCDICNKAFHTPSQLRKHRKTHGVLTSSPPSEVVNEPSVIATIET